MYIDILPDELMQNNRTANSIYYTNNVIKKFTEFAVIYLYTFKYCVIICIIIRQSGRIALENPF